MANDDAPHGFRFLTLHRGFPPHSVARTKLAAVGTAIFQNDVVHEVGGASGQDAPPIQPFGTGIPGTTIPGGVAANYGAVSTLTHHLVYDDPNAEYEAQDDDGTTGIVATDIGKNANVATGAGSATTGFSGHEIEKASVNVSAARDIRLVERFPDIENVFGPHCRVIVKFNKLRSMPATVGV